MSEYRYSKWSDGNKRFKSKRDAGKKMEQLKYPMPMTRRERRFEEKVDEYRQKLPDILVSPFNYDNWSQV